mmetsp:Transcript_25412/g.39041  ORF Transcript_25412/g.39041 Transcript_25412/m.39041 type:complete len:287 (+) Transcript_25412:82-942(+)
MITSTKTMFALSLMLAPCLALVAPNNKNCGTRREIIGWSFAAATFLGQSQLVHAEDSVGVPDSLNVDNFMRQGRVSNPMGVSGQAGKSRPETGVILREGSAVSQDKTGNVLTEIVVGDNAVLASFVCPWSLAKGAQFDVECRDSNTGDGAFLAVTGTTNGVSLKDLSKNFFVEQIFSPFGRFSSYGSPTDIKVKSSSMSEDGNYRTIELGFSTLSQSTQTEIPRYAVISATIPEGSDRVVLLVASALANRFRRQGVESAVRSTVASFRAAPAPKSSLRLRGKAKKA